MQKAQEQVDAQSKEVGETCMLLAMAHGAAQGQREQAKALYERAAAVFSAALGAGHAQTLEAQKMVQVSQDTFAEGLEFVKGGDYARAVRLLNASFEIREAAYGEQSREVGDVCRLLGVAFKAQGRAEQARAVYGRAAAAFEAVLGAEHAETVAAREQAERA